MGDDEPEQSDEYTALDLRIFLSAEGAEERSRSAHVDTAADHLRAFSCSSALS